MAYTAATNFSFCGEVAEAVKVQKDLSKVLVLKVSRETAQL